MIHVPLPPVLPIVQYGVCPGYATACTQWGDPPIVTFETPADLKRSWWHEMGHVFDAEVMEPRGLRPAFALIDGRPWKTPASEERFAQAYALCALNRRLRKTFVGWAGFRATVSQFARMCNLIRQTNGPRIEITAPTHNGGTACK